MKYFEYTLIAIFWICVLGFVVDVVLLFTNDFIHWMFWWSLFGGVGSFILVNLIGFIDFLDYKKHEESDNLKNY